MNTTFLVTLDLDSADVAHLDKIAIEIEDELSSTLPVVSVRPWQRHGQQLNQQQGLGLGSIPGLTDGNIPPSAGLISPPPGGPII